MKACVILTLACFIGGAFTDGFITTIDKYPFATALLCNYGGSGYRKACGGTILSATAILSAASCFNNDSNQEHPADWWRARVGSSNSDSRGTVYLIRRIVRHPDFNLTTRINDMAVLRTTLTMVLVPGLVQAADIAGGAYPLTNNHAVWGLRWGSGSQTSSSGQLHEMQLWIVDQEMCSNGYSQLGFTVTNNMLCAGPPYEGIRGRCQEDAPGFHFPSVDFYETHGMRWGGRFSYAAGDLGSPLVHNGVVVGVFLRMEGCVLGHPNINTRVPSYARWIEATAVSS